MIPSETIEEIKSRTDVLEVISDYVDLKKAGSNYRGLSPFNQERTPSFYVVPSKGFFKDFSSGKAGDAITFLMEAEGMSYLEAIKHLAKKYGIEIQEEAPTDEELLARNERESLFIVMKFAAQYFQDNLWKHDDGRAIGLSYFKERGFSEATIQEFGLGYTLDQWDGLIKEAEQKNYSVDLLEKAGLVVKREEENKQYDRFRGRVMFPIYNVSGRILAFGGRILGNKTEKIAGRPSAGRPPAKYINSPETPIYHKSDVLYGIFQAKQAIRQEEVCYLVEGYTDVISLHQAGVKNVVASSGTSLTHEQIRLVSRYTKNVVVLFDGDAAGLKASFRGIDMILEGGLNVKAVVLPEGEDPDTLARRLSAQELTNFLQAHQEDFISFKTNIYQKEAAGDPIRRAELIREVVSTIAKVPDPIQRQVYVKTTSDRLEMDESILITELNKIHLREQRSASRRSSREEAGASGAEAAAPELEPPVELPQHSALYYKEQGVIRLLILYGHLDIAEGRKVYHYILEELEDAPLQTDLYQRILTLYQTRAAQGVEVTQEYLVEQGDEAIRKEVIDLVVDHYVLSENWELRFKIYVNLEIHILPQALERGILELKHAYLAKLLEENRQQLLETASEDIQMQILQRYQTLKQSQMEIAKQLGIVVS